MARESPRVEALTGREADVLACLADGLSNSEIAERLFLSTSTVKWYVRQLNSKLDTTNRDEIVQRAQIGWTARRRDAPQLVAVKHNLPSQTTPFVGREAELEELAQILTLAGCAAGDGAGSRRHGQDAAGAGSRRAAALHLPRRRVLRPAATVDRD